MTRWVESRLPVISVDEKERIVSFSKRSVFELAPGDLYYAEGAFEFLDEPGEWYLDCGRRHALLPAASRRKARRNLEAIAPVLAQVAPLRRPARSRAIRRARSSCAVSPSPTPNGISPRASQRATTSPRSRLNPKAEIGGFAQAAVGVPGAVWGEGLRRLRLRALPVCEPRQLRPGTGARLPGQPHHPLRILRPRRRRHQDRRDAPSATGRPNKPAAMRSATAASTTAARCFTAPIGIWIGQSPDNRITHNLIHDFYYTGISIGWTWGYGPALATNNTRRVQSRPPHRRQVRRRRPDPQRHGRHLHAGHAAGHDHPQQPLARHRRPSATAAGASTSTKAAAASWPRTTSSIAPRMAGFTSTTARPTSSATTSSPSRATTRSSAPAPSRTSASSFQTNIVYFDQGVLFGGNWAGDQYTLDWNLYFDARPGAKPEAMSFAGASVEQWRARGHDLHSLIADPLFAGPAKDDFRLRPDSPALSLGFRPIDLRQVGP